MGDGLFCGVELAARVERLETEAIVGAVSGRRSGGFVVPLGGGAACFAEVGSPLNKVVGVGFGGVPSVGEWEEVERAYAEVGAPVQVELAHLADSRIGAELTGRGYRLTSFENVLGRRLAGRTSSASSQIEAHRGGRDVGDGGSVSVGGADRGGGGDVGGGGLVSAGAGDVGDGGLASVGGTVRGGGGDVGGGGLVSAGGGDFGGGGLVSAGSGDFGGGGLASAGSGDVGGGGLASVGIEAGGGGGGIGVGRSVSAGVEVRCDDESGFEVWLDIVVDGFASPDDDGSPTHEEFPREAIAAVMRDMAGVGDTRRYIAYRDGVPVGGASMRIDDGVAALAGAATVPAHRRRGVQTALLAARLADAAAAGCDLAVITTEPGSKSQENAQNSGFTLLYTRAILTKTPA